MTTAGRFEWLTMPAPSTSAGHGQEMPSDAQTRTCPFCHWTDTIGRFGRIAHEANPNAPEDMKRCWRCGAFFDLAVEVGQYFSQRNIQLPATSLNVQCNARSLLKRQEIATSGDFDLYLEASVLGLRRGFDELLSLGLLNIRHYSHQIEAAQRILKSGCRFLLADEVGTGKTIVAGIVIKESLIRGLAKRICILVPAGLVDTWRSELQEKFREADFHVYRGPADAVKDKIIVSYSRGRMPKNAAALQRQPFDLVVADEAHRLRTRSTQCYEMVKGLRTRGVLLVTATPVANTVADLYAICSLIDRTSLGTVRSFNRMYVHPKDPRVPMNTRHLKAQLKHMMSRARRDQIGIHFNGRKAGLYYVTLTPDERRLYDAVTEYIRDEYRKEVYEETGRRVHLMQLTVLQRELTSSNRAIRTTLAKIAQRPTTTPGTRARLEEFVRMAERIAVDRKIAALKETLDFFPEDRAVTFTEFQVTARQIAAEVEAMMGRKAFLFTGSTPISARPGVLEAFQKTPRAVLVATDAGSEGLNLQFAAHRLVNYDLPWNPQRVEQRIGRLDRLGQEHPVTVISLAAAETIEAHLLDVVASKLRLFSLIVGEAADVLGAIGEGESFERLIRRIVVGASNDDEVRSGFARLGGIALAARERYDQTKATNMVLTS